MGQAPATSQKSQSLYNRLNVINLVRTKKLTSRIELSRETKLKTSTISNIINDFVNDGLVVEKGIGESSLGRKPKLIELNRLAFYAIGVEIGVMHISVGLMDVWGNLAGKIETSVNEKHGKSEIMNIVICSIKEVLSEAEEKCQRVKGIGVGVMGLVEPESGILRFSLHHNWKDLPIKSILEEELNFPVVVDNDARAMVLGEYWFGAGRGVKNLVLINVCEGIGSGMIINGNLYYGASGIAGEIGHTSIDYNGPKCGCGNYGCLETFVSDSAITTRARRAIEEGVQTVITRLIDGKLEKITDEVVCQAAKKGDGLSLKLLKNAGEYLGVGIANVVNIFDPEIILIGGRMIQTSRIIFEWAKRVAMERVLEIRGKSVAIIPFLLGKDVGTIGAATLITKDIFYPNEERISLYWPSLV
jgi:glucokinase-like ROK family protein